MKYFINKALSFLIIIPVLFFLLVISFSILNHFGVKIDFIFQAAFVLLLAVVILYVKKKQDIDSSSKNEEVTSVSQFKRNVLGGTGIYAAIISSISLMIFNVFVSVNYELINKKLSSGANDTLGNGANLVMEIASTIALQPIIYLSIGLAILGLIMSSVSIIRKKELTLLSIYAFIPIFYEMTYMSNSMVLSHYQPIQ